VTSNVTRDGLTALKPDREALVGVAAGRHNGKRGEEPVVPDARFSSYYGKPIISGPVWKAPEIPGYLFLGGLAGASSLLAAGADLTGRPALARVAKTGAAAAGGLSLAALVKDLGKPSRFLNMLRTFKVTSPMSIGSWTLAGYVPAAGVAAASALTGRAARLGAVSTAAAAAIGPFIAAYTSALICDTAVPAWHDGHRQMPFVFVGSAATTAAGLGLVAAPLRETAPARQLALLGAATELVAARRMEQGMEMVAEPYRAGKAGRLMRAGEALAAAGLIAAGLGRRSRLASMCAGVSLLAASAATRFGIFEAGMRSAADPRSTVAPQRSRLSQRRDDERHRTTVEAPA
jgi:hypothetical protein